MLALLLLSTALPAGIPAPALPLPQEPAPIRTDREGARLPELPAQEEGFLFAVFGDRTGGPPEGIEVLDAAVHEVNLLDPDLVMTVGDLINGYNQTDAWMEQMREYRRTMDQLECAWFPVAGNHDVYWRGDGRPAEEHEAHYEQHFGPLWYSFTHKGSGFIVLYTDEPNPETGERNFSKAECQRMSTEQLGWLRGTLEAYQELEHVFVFVHHPRWTGGQYGDDWNRVHQALAGAGNVRAVFGGHIHHMRYDGPRDGIEYFTLATVGGHQSSLVPEAGWLHHYELVHVRPDGIHVVSYPVGSATNPRALTAEVVEETTRLSRSLRPEFEAPLRWDAVRGASSDLVLRWRNPTSQPVELALTLGSDDARWGFLPDHLEQVVAPGAVLELRTRAMRSGGGLDEGFRLPTAQVHANYVTDEARYAIPTQVVPLPFEATSLPTPPRPSGERVLALDGRSARIEIPSKDLQLPAGVPLTLECWYMPGDLAGRRGLVAKTESSEFGLFVSDYGVDWSVHLDGAYRSARAPAGTLERDRWHHLAGVFDGSEVRLYVDGQLVDRQEASGQRTLNDLPLMIGADVDRQGRPTSFATGRIDEVRLSDEALYSGRTIDLERRLPAARDALLHLRMDGMVGPWLHDEGRNGLHPTLSGSARLERISE